MENRSYDAWLHWFITMRCNLDCSYCFKNSAKKTAQLRPINVKNVIHSLNASQRIYRISMTGGGEPFLVPNINEFCAELTKKHYLSINTNLTAPKIKDFAGLVDPEKVIIIHASLHLEELFKKRLVQRFIENHQLLKEKGIRLEVKAVAYPDITRKVDEYKKFFFQKGIEFEFDPFIGRYNQRSYPDDYTEEELKVFALNPEDRHVFYQKNRLCNAGYNAGVVMPDGKIYCCLQVSKSLGDVNREIRFTGRLTQCPVKKCECPLNYYDKKLFQKALATQGIQARKPNPIINSIGLSKMSIGNFIWVKKDGQRAKRPNYMLR